MDSKKRNGVQTALLHTILPHAQFFLVTNYATLSKKVVTRLHNLFVHLLLDATALLPCLGCKALCDHNHFIEFRFMKDL